MLIGVRSVTDYWSETCVGWFLKEGWVSLSIVVTFVQHTPPFSVCVLSLHQGKGYSEISIVGSKSKCVCVVYHQVVGAIDTHV